MKYFLLTFLVIFYGCSNNGKKSEDELPEKAEANLTGEQLSRTYCSNCHLYPSPELLDKKSWEQGVLPQMGYRFGIYGKISRDSLLEKGIARKIVEEAGVFPVKQLIDNEKWEKIKQFYLEKAPDSLPVAEDRTIEKGMPGFKVVMPNGHKTRAMTTSIKYDVESKYYYLANSYTKNNSVSIFNAKIEPEVELGLPFPISDVTIRSDTLLILMMGHFIPSDEPAGMLVKAFKGPGNSGYKGGGFSVLLKDLQRPVHVAYSDVNEDGGEDIVVCEYGNHTGSLSLFLKRKNGYDKKILNKAPGAIKAIIKDINHDSLEDIIALMAQGDEGIDIYYNNGDGQFKKERVLRFPSSYGSVSFSLVDFNQDGFSDILYTNGDNADYSPVLKPYHGIHIFLNDGTNHFNESYFFHQNGAYKALAHDFDMDGDIDIASIAFFPDFFGRPEEGFVYLENVSTEEDFNFIPSTFAGSDLGRWITMNIADVDQDGDSDLLLGSFTGMEIRNDTTGTLLGSMAEKSPSFILLKNMTK